MSTENEDTITKEVQEEKTELGEEVTEAVRSEFVAVQDPNGDLLELPTNQDNTLYISTLQSNVAAGATGLKYKNPKTGASRAVAVDPTGTKFLAPTDGWEDKVFSVIMAAPSRGSEVSVKRRKMGDSDGEEDSDGEGRHGRKRLLESGPSSSLGERRPVDLIVLGVNFKTTDETFKTYFEQFGSVVFAEIKRTSDGNSKGFGFVQMGSLEDQEKVLNQSNHTLDTRRCEVKIPETRIDYPGTPAGRPGRFPVNKIFIGRLISKISDSTLRDFFESEAQKISDKAKVIDVFIPKPFRGFGFVTFSNADVAEKICSVSNYVIEGTSIGVSLAIPRDETSSMSSPHNDFGYPYGYNKGNHAAFNSFPTAFSEYGFPNPSGPPPMHHQRNYGNGWGSSNTPPRPAHPRNWFRKS